MPSPIDRNLNDERLRIELSSELMLNIRQGKSYEANQVRILRAEETRSGRDRWVDVLAEGKKGVRRAPIVATEKKGAGECSYADLLAAVIRIIEVSADA